MKKRIVLFLRFFLILTTILLMTYSRKGLRFGEPGYLIALFYFLSNIGLYWMPERLFKKPVISFLVFLFDVTTISLAIYVSEGMATDFYLIYFLAIFISSVGQTIGGSLPIAIVASVFYGWLIYRANPGISLLDSKFLIRIPFLFIISLISSYWSEAARREVKEKEELEKFNRELKKEVERIAAQEIELRRYNEKIINSVASGIIVVRTDSIFATINPEAERVFGYRKDELTGLAMKDMPGFAKLWSKMDRAMGDNKPLLRDEVTVTSKSGEEIPLGFNVTPMMGQEDTITACVVILKDLSEVRRLEGRLKHAERLTYLGKMSSWIAHEIRNPLTSIAGFAQLLMETRNKDKITRFTSEINKAAMRINHIIDDVLTFARARKVESTEVDLRVLIESIVADFKANIAIVREITPVPALIKGETESLRRVFVNLISNGIEALNDNGRVEIEFERSTGFLVTEIRDNGKGISKENLAKLFEPFFTTKPRGTGLGLAIVKKIVEEHDGKIEMQSEEGKGTTCRVYLPA